MAIKRISQLEPGLSAVGPNDMIPITQVTVNQDQSVTFRTIRVTPAQIFVAALNSFQGGLINNGGVVNSTFPFFRTDTFGLLPGDIWSDDGELTVFGTTAPDPDAPPVYFGQITAAQLLILGGANLPIVLPTVGSLQLWNNGGVICVA